MKKTTNFMAEGFYLKAKIRQIALVLLPIIFIALTSGYLYLKDQKESAKYDFVVQGVSSQVKLKDFRGKQMMVYFGYGLCPDICPTSLVEIANALNMLSDKEKENTEAIFISLDPARDKPAQLDKFAKYFHPKIIGATASDEYLKKLTQNYGANYQRVELNNSSLSYSLAHTADIYLIDKNGKLKATLPFGVSGSEIVMALRK
jgi:protein SCO1